MAIKRILVPIDLSANSLAGLDYAVALAKAVRAEIYVLYVVEPLYYAMSEFAAPAVGELLEEQRRSSRAELTRLEQRYAARKVPLRILQQVGTAHQTVVANAKRLKADLIVMATHGRTGVSHFLLGSVAERVVRAASCPVLTVRPSRTSRRKSVRKRATRSRS